MKIKIPVHLRWSDMDAYGHVNNVDMLRLLEIARIEAFWVSDQAKHHTGILDASPGSATATFVARQEIEYVAPLTYRQAPVIVELWIGHVGGASIDVSYLIRDDDRNQSQGDESAQQVSATSAAEPGEVAAVSDQPASASGAAEPTVYAIASTTLVMVDTAKNAPRRLTVREREVWAGYVHPPVQFKHRR